MALVLLTVGAFTLLTGAWAFLAPGSFYDVIAAFPPRNDHVLRDVGSFQAALGLAGILAARRPAWHTPMLAVFAVMYGLHTVSHLIDIDNADTEALGVTEFTLLLLATLVLAGLFAREARA